VELVEAYFTALRWGWFVALGIGFLAPPLGFLLFIIWLVLLIATGWAVLSAAWEVHGRRARKRARTAPRAANGRFIRASLREEPATERAS
jgi:hypothetical protein